MIAIYQDAPASQVVAQAPRQVVQGAPSAQATQVVVNGKRPEISNRIDRKVYDVKGDAEAQVGTAADILGKLPSVTVLPNGRVALRGDTGVLVLVDGKPPVMGNAAIQSLPASEIDRIEIMTNPSAEYSPDSRSGIINIITKKRHSLGWSGNLDARASTHGDTMLDLSATAESKRFSFTADTSTQTENYAYKGSTQISYPGISNSSSRNNFTSRNFGGELHSTVKFGEWQSLTLSLQSYSAWSERNGLVDYSAASVSNDSQEKDDISSGSGRAELKYSYNSTPDGRDLTLDAWHDAWDLRETKRFRETYQESSEIEDYGTFDDTFFPADEAKVDFHQHFANGHEFSSGIDWQSNSEIDQNNYYDDGSIPGPFVDGSRYGFEGHRQVIASYVTYQRPLWGGWLMLPGLRAESEQISLSSQARIAPEIHLFPSLHLSHPLASGDFKLSYSRRVSRPGLSSFDPQIVYRNSLSAYEGNINLKPSYTDSYEIEYDKSKGRDTYNISGYLRQTSGAIDNISRDVGDGVILTQPFNVGRNESGGIDLSIKSSLSSKIKSSFSADVYYNSISGDAAIAGRVKHAVAFEATYSLELTPGEKDDIRSNLTINSKSINAQGYTEGYGRFDVIWRHTVSKKLNLVFSAINLIGNDHFVQVVDAPNLHSRQIGPGINRLFRIALSRKFGG